MLGPNNGTVSLVGVVGDEGVVSFNGMYVRNIGMFSVKYVKNESPSPCITHNKSLGNL